MIFKFLFYFIFTSQFLYLTSCLNSSVPDQSPDETSVTTNDRPELELDNYDIEEIADAFASVDIPLNHLTANGLLPPTDSKYAKQEHIKEILKALLNGPCHKNYEQVFDKLLKLILERVKDLSEKLLNESDPAKIDHLNQRIEYLENLEEKIQNKKNECANGISDCSDEFKKNVIKLISEFNRAIVDIEAKLENAKDPRKIDYLNHVLEKAKKDRDHLKDLLKNCQ